MGEARATEIIRTNNLTHWAKFNDPARSQSIFAFQQQPYRTPINLFIREGPILSGMYLGSLTAASDINHPKRAGDKEPTTV